MDEEAFNLSVRRFLKKLGVTSQREIELGVREQLADPGALSGDETLEGRAVVTGVEPRSSSRARPRARDRDHRREIALAAARAASGRSPNGRGARSAPRLSPSPLSSPSPSTDDLVVLVEPDVDGLAVVAGDLDLPGGAVLESRSTAFAVPGCAASAASRALSARTAHLLLGVLASPRDGAPTPRR